MEQPGHFKLVKRKLRWRYSRQSTPVADAGDEDTANTGDDVNLDGKHPGPRWGPTDI